MEEPHANREINWEALKKDGGGIGYVLAAAIVVLAVPFVAGGRGEPVEQRIKAEYGAECFDLKEEAVKAHRKLDSLDRRFLAEPKEGANTPEAREVYSGKRAGLDREYRDKAMQWRQCIENRKRNAPNVAVQQKSIPRARSNL